MVSVLKLVANQGATQRIPADTFRVVGQSIVIPRPVLAAASAYVIKVQANKVLDANIRTSPFSDVSSLNWSSADTVSSIWTTP